MAATSRKSETALRGFFERVWRDDVRPLLAGRQNATRRRLASWGGQTAAATGALLDGAFRLRGRPFTRSLTVLGATLGALLPDAWDWNWWKSELDPQTRARVSQRIRSAAEQLSEDAALALLDLDPDASAEQLRSAWRAAALRWHPDKAPSVEQQREYQLRFMAYQAAYRRLQAAYAAGDLPRSGDRRANAP